MLLVFHGNGYVLADMVGDELPRLHSIGANLLVIDYRGYGSSSRVSPDEDSINSDAEAALKFLLSSRKAQRTGDIYLLGRSVGTGPATYLAAKNPDLGGLILESPFTSIDDAANRFWYVRAFPLGLLLRTHFDNASRMNSMQLPLLIVSGTADNLTPVWMAEDVYSRAHQPKRLYLVKGAGHDDLLLTGGHELLSVLQEFVQDPPEFQVY